LPCAGDLQTACSLTSEERVQMTEASVMRRPFLAKS
jgi:hypothetical protein